jgi:type I restriction enzyme, S subunit
MQAPNLQASRKTKKTPVGDIPVEWAVRTLDHMCRFASGGTPDKAVADHWRGETPWFTAKDLKTFRLGDSLDRITRSGAAERCRLVPAGSVLILVRGMTLDKDVPVCVTTKESAFNQDLKALIPNEDVLPDYLGYALVAKKEELLAMVDHAGHGTGRLQTELLKALPVPVPPVSEQKHLVAVLTAWDKAISDMERLTAAAEERKRGLMQQLLTGRKRFKEFKGVKWRSVRMGELLQDVDRYVEFDNSHSYRLASVRRRSEGLFFREELRGSEIKTKVMKTIRTGDFLVSKMQVVHGAWGLVTPEFDGMFVSDSYIALVPRDAQLKIKFFNYLSQTRHLRHLAYISSHGVHIEKMTFNLDDFLHEKITIPPTVAEQSKIVGVLAACDREIELLGKQLEALKEQKRGLMQKLLTGEVRVKAESRKQKWGEERAET